VLLNTDLPIERGLMVGLGDGWPTGGGVALNTTAVILPITPSNISAVNVAAR